MDDLRRNVQVQRYYPNVLAPAEEFKTLAKLENEEFSAAWNAVWKWFLNTYVYEIDIDGAERWEEMLKIIPPQGASLEVRKKAILAKLNTLLPYTIRRLQEILDNRYGAGLTKAKTTKAYELMVTIDNKVILQVNEMRILLRSIIPANLIIKVIQELSWPGELYIGGQISLKERIYIKTNTDFSIEGDILSAFQVGGQISLKERIYIKTEA